MNLNGVNNIYLLDSDTQIEQYKAQKVSYQGNNGRGGLPEGAASQTSAIIIEDEEKYSALGAGSRVTMDLSGGKGKAEAIVVANGTEALAGSKLQAPITEETQTGFEVITGSMKYNGTGWTTAENSIFRYTDNAMADVINEVMNKLLGNAEHGTIFQLDFSDVNMTGTAGDIVGAIKGYETNKESIKYVAGADSVIKSLDGAGEVRDIPEGTVFNLSVSEKGNIGLKYAGEESMEADIVLTDTGHYSFADGVGIVNEDGTISIKDVAFKKGDFVNFWSGLGNCGQTVTTNFAFTVTDDAGTATKISAGLALSGNNQGESLLKDNLNVNFTTDAGQVIKANGTDFQAFWNADSSISFVFNKNGKTSAVISGNFSVKNAIINDKPASNTSNKTQSAGSSSSPSLNSTFDGTVYDKRRYAKRYGYV